jgi:ABC-2 type transport system ATP-binding protein
MVQELAIDTRDLTKQFDRQIVVRDIELQIGVGEVYGLIGPNGAGKTTLIRMLATAEEPSAGEIYLFGERLLRDQGLRHIKQRLGYLPDDYPLYDDLTVWDYLDYFARLYHLQGVRRRRRLNEVLELVNLTGKRNSPIQSLSRGMKQRLSLARTIIHEPILLLLDEPVSGLDPVARMQFRDSIKILREAGMTILISSHVLSDLSELCTSIGIMELGSLVESTSLADLYQRLSRPRIELSTLGEVKELVTHLHRHKQVTDLEVIPGTSRVKIHFSGSWDDQAHLLRSLVHEGIPLNEFRCDKEDLESIFLKLEHKQVS